MNQLELTNFSDLGSGGRNSRENNFRDYIKRTSEMVFHIVQSDGKEFKTPYKHRWEKSYRRGILRKLYQLDTWAKRHKLSCGMISLTSSQRGLTDEEILDRFKESWAKFQDNLNKMGFQVFRLYEPHESGIPHIHALLFGDCSEDNIKRLENLWHKKYKMGYEGVDFKFSFGMNNNIESVVNYLMKYLSKTIVSDILKDEKLVRFHSLFYTTKTRMFSSSRYLSYVMRRIRTCITPINYIFADNMTIYDANMDKVLPYKFQVKDGIRYKYDLLGFEIKPKTERDIDLFNFYEGNV